MKSAHHSLPRRIAFVTLASGLSAGTALWGAQEATSEARSSPLANEVTQLAELVERQQQQIEEQRRLLEAQGLLLRRLSEDVEELRQGAPTLTRASWSESGPAAALAAAPAPADEAAGSLAARYSRLNLNDQFIVGGKLQDLTLGLNWYLNPNTRLMSNYVLADRTDIGKTNILQTRFQVDF